MTTGMGAARPATSPKGLAKDAYAKAVFATKDAMQAMQKGQVPNLQAVKRTVQLIVDRVMGDEATMLGLTTVRGYDDHSVTHAVNVCIFAVVLGRRLGLSRVQRYDLGLAALFHDCGKSRLGAALLEKPAPLSNADWRAMASHPWLGVLTLFLVREHDAYPYRAMMVAYEHHLRADDRGYPARLRPREVGIFSKIVAVIEAFDAATSNLNFQRERKTPAEFVAEMREMADLFLDPAVVMAFTDALGRYPVGTVLVLDTFEMAIVHSANPNPDHAARPMALVISDAEGNLQHPGTLVDLAETDASGSFRRSIVEIIDPDRYGIRVGDYFL
jgi:HD-GYP domain-containing protein (c-di-GMP phosphodiesterase class II)